LTELKTLLSDEASTLRSFRNQIDKLLQEQNSALLYERLEKARQYYDGRLRDWLKHLLAHIACARRYAQVKLYIDDLEGFDVLLQNQRERIAKAAWLAESILTGKALEGGEAAIAEVKRDRALLLTAAEEIATARPRPTKKRSAVASKKKNAKTGETYRITEQMFLSGQTIQEIAKARNLADSTIEGHVIKAVMQGTVPRQRYISDKAFEAIRTELMRDNDELDVSRVVRALGEEYTYNQVRTVVKLIQPAVDEDED
jgi:DNA-binding NarL/FixJ family response regulator